jgi:hypothetical protein
VPRLAIALTTIPLALAALLAAGCSSDKDEQAPSACLAGSAAYLEMIRRMFFLLLNSKYIMNR